MRINVHAGHNPDGKKACGAVGFIRESAEARRVKDEVISQLQQMGHIVYDCTCECGANQSDVLNRIVTKCNAHTVDLDVSIHFNSGAKDPAGNGKTTGTEAYIYDASSKAKKYAENVCAAIAELGYRNRGVKANQKLYVLKNTKAPAMLIECCFVDDKDDAQLYDYKSVADAIVYGITGQQAVVPVPTVPDTLDKTAETTTGDSGQIYRVQIGAYAVKGNADAMRAKLSNAGFDAIITTA